MKLPADFVLTNYQTLRNEIARNDEYNPRDEGTLEMSEEQYIAYKELVWRDRPDRPELNSDPIMAFDGMKIVIPSRPVAT